MARTKLYAGIYVVLFVLATVQALVEGVESIDYWTAFGIIIVLSFAKAIVVAAYYQHLRWEPRSVSYLMVGGLFVALALTTAAAYSIL
ncbi:hypothetical protein BRC92_01255 [Halobacteriales archaeon QS_4_69_31]|jgi:cytochrome c oxidase subunit 4|nr:MAG: hypothetical protein BRC92_01255 [Halobacteriales archaeon QS_4_69_31]